MPKSISFDAEYGEQLELLAEMGRDFATSLDIEASLIRAIRRIVRYLDAEAASLFLLEDDRLVCRACFGPVDIKGIELAPDRGIVGRSIAENTCQIVRDAESDPDFSGGIDAGTGFRSRSILCAPLSVNARRVGAIELLNKRGGDGRFTEHDGNVLQVLATSAALAIINAQLTVVAVEQERVNRDIELAVDIQRSLLPPRGDDDAPIVGLNLPARSVTGDFYDVFPVAGGRLCFSIGDVSGKGINAALLMAKASSLFRCLGKSNHHPGRLLAVLNNEFCETGTRGMFVTMVAGLYDPSTDVIEFANAGHEPPLFRHRNGEYEALTQSAPPLGISADLVGDEGFPLSRITLAGGAFVAFTDGATEARRPNGTPLEADGLKACLDEHWWVPRCRRLDAMLATLEQAGVMFSDDLTLLLVQNSRSA